MCEVEEEDGEGFTALHLAAALNLAAICGLLLAKGAAVDPRDKRGRSPLLLATKAGHLHTVQLLLGKYGTGR